ncbi:hypothetical protein [Micromonospora inositola]|uniref:Uncharacterized protein n=1 Tax=Micromonospora inositola TaxID=47865 RepID=A0A1C5K3A3_9ACTN|nr:hypothetical protein [Micromonospora inositola]SCG77071.1 hypothetical protein GA0070613_6146 [Micromonospora inositola]
MSDSLGPAGTRVPPPRGRWRRSGRRARLAGGLTGVVLAIALTGFALAAGRASTDGAKTADNPVPAAWARPVVDADSLGQRSGVRITRVAVTGGGGLVDLRFTVVDPELANTLHDDGTPPAVVDEQSGLVVHELLMNHSHTGAYKTGITYYLVFENPGNWIHRGGRVSVLLGNAQVEHVAVR